MDCHRVSQMPHFARKDKKLYSYVFLNGPMNDVPNLSQWTNLRKVNVERTMIPCGVIDIWRATVSYKIEADRCQKRIGM